MPRIPIVPYPGLVLLRCFMPIEEYIEKFSNLRTDKNRNRYPASTKHCAPHKPVLLLAVMDLIEQGAINNNFIEPTMNLVDTFKKNGVRA